MDKDPSTWFEEAVRLEEAGSELEALDLWRALVQMRPNAITYCKLARLARELGHIDEAANAYRSAINLNGKCTHGYLGLAILENDRERYTVAEELLTTLVNFAPTAPAYTVLGFAQSCQGKEEESRASYREALTWDPDYEEALYNLGASVTFDFPNKAEKYFRRAIKIDPDYALAHRELGWLLQRNRELSKSKQHLLRSLELKPDDEWCHIYLGGLYWLEEDPASAEEEYRTAVVLEPKWAIPRWSLGNLFLDQGRLDHAEKEYALAARLDPDDPAGVAGVGKVLARRGEVQQAGEYLERVIAIDPDCIQVSRLREEIRKAESKKYSSD